MAKQITRDPISGHNQQDQALAARLGLTGTSGGAPKMNPNSGLNKIPIRVKSEVVSSHERRETIVKND